MKENNYVYLETVFILLKKILRGRILFLNGWISNKCEIFVELDYLWFIALWKWLCIISQKNHSNIIRKSFTYLGRFSLLKYEMKKT